MSIFARLQDQQQNGDIYVMFGDPYGTLIVTATERNTVAIGARHSRDDDNAAELDWNQIARLTLGLVEWLEARTSGGSELYNDAADSIRRAIAQAGR